MKTLSLAVFAICMFGSSGCVVDHHDFHRGWWDEHHRGERYEEDRAEREHREWCAKSYDRSCEGWYKR